MSREWRNGIVLYKQWDNIIINYGMAKGSRGRWGRGGKKTNASFWDLPQEKCVRRTLKSPRLRF